MRVKSDLVVISWWSNCLGLACLHNLVNYTRNRNIYFIQVGKPEEQKERFRAHLPPAVEELPYPPDRGAEDWRVREAVACELLGDRDGLWFIDHDLFVQEDCEGWLDDIDRRFEEWNVCLCHPSPVRGPSITNPAFWLSPVRFPPGTPSFARLPYQEEPVASRPYALRQSAALIMPEKDTLVAAMEFLQERGMVCGFPLTEGDRVPDGPARFPRFEHIGGLYTFTGEVLPEPLHDWMARCVEQFTAFYAACPPEWLEIEDPVLMERLEEFRQAVSRDVQMCSAWIAKSGPKPGIWQSPWSNSESIKSQSAQITGDYKSRKKARTEKRSRNKGPRKSPRCTPCRRTWPAGGSTGGISWPPRAPPRL